MSKRSFSKHKVIKLEPGFYAIRYLSNKRDAPVAILQSIECNDGSVLDFIGFQQGEDVLLSPDARMAVCLAKRSDARLLISVLGADGGGLNGFAFDIERLPERLPNFSSVSSSLVFLSGHIEWRGDVQCAPGSYLGTPNAGSRRIEGFCIKWLKNIDKVDIRYGCTFGDQGDSTTAIGGGFVGSRGKSSAITSLWIALEGAEAEHYELRYTAVFAMAGKVDGRQAEVVSGTDDTDYLVGLWVSVVDAGLVSPDIPHENGRKVKDLKTFRA